MKNVDSTQRCGAGVCLANAGTVLIKPKVPPKLRHLINFESARSRKMINGKAQQNGISVRPPIPPKPLHLQSNVFVKHLMFSKFADNRTLKDLEISGETASFLNRLRRLELNHEAERSSENWLLPILNHMRDLYLSNFTSASQSRYNFERTLDLAESFAADKSTTRSLIRRRTP